MSSIYGASRRRIVGESWFWIVMAVVAVAVLSIGFWAFRTVTAPTAGKAGAFRQQQSANNRVFAQQAFEQSAADFDGYLAKIRFATTAYKAQPTDVNLTNLQGLQQQCVNTAQQYNADARKYLLRDFRSADLPVSLNAADCG